MMFKNATKLLVANFSLFWKVLLYKLIAVAVCALLALPVLWSWIYVLDVVNFGTAFVNFATNTVFLNLTELFENLFVLVQTLLSGFALLIQTNIFAFVYTMFLILILIPFLWGLSSVPAGECLYAYMATLSKPKFSVAFVSKLGISCVYSILRTLLNSALLVVFASGFYGLLTLTSIQGVFQVVLPFIIFIYIVIAMAFIITFFSGWMPATVTFNIAPAVTFKKGLKASFRRFFKILSTMLFVMFVAVIGTLMLTSVSLVIILPFTEVLVIMFEMVMFFESQGNRYYVDMDTICAPKKLEECDKLKKTKSII